MTRSSYLLGALMVVLATACSDLSPVTGPSETQPSFSGGSSGGGGGGGGSGGGGGTKTGCTNAITVTATATEALAGNSFSAQYALTSCQSKTHVGITATDLSTGVVVFSAPDLSGLVALWTLPYKLTSYRVDARAYTTTGTVATASTIVATDTPLPCDVVVNNNTTVGYWGIYAAVWVATDVQDCGLGGSVHLQITNLNTGQVELDYPTLGMSSFIDFEGPVVSYSTPYRVLVEYRTSSGELRGSVTKDIVSSVLK